jgi:tetratricopeptide (TPR) repeat protein
MLLSYWGSQQTQYDAASVLKPDPEDKNVSPWEMEAYVRGMGFEAVTRVNGDLNQLKGLLRAGFPVIVETWYVRDAHDQLGHYRLIIGYDDSRREFLTYDSLHGPDVTVGYRELDELWRVFNRIYLVVCTPDRWESLASVLADGEVTQASTTSSPGAPAAALNEAAMYEHALEMAQSEAAAPPSECVAYADCADWATFSWFNVGSSLTSLGRHQQAASAYDKARQLGLHYRMLWYQFGPYESYHGAGRYADVIALADATLGTANNLEESYYWRGMARLALGDVGGARSDLEAALRFHKGWSPAASALANLEGS